MTETLRPIEPLSLGDVAAPDPGQRPDFEWIPIDRLFVNDAYQRRLAERSHRAIRKIASRFDWAKLKALSVIDLGDGRYEVTDGQHTAIGAATHGGIEALPCLVSTTRSLEKRADAFVGLNRDRVGMTELQVFHAELKAGDELAVEIQQGVERAGGRVLRSPAADCKIGDLMCIGSLRQLAKKGGPAYVKRAVGIGVQANLAPIKAPVLRGLVRLIWEGDYAGKLTDPHIIDVLRVYGQDKLIEKARALRAEEGGTPAESFAKVVARLA